MAIDGGLNQQIKEHARAYKQWKYQEKADKAYSIFEVINEKLFDGKLPQVVIGFDTRLKKSGEYYFQGDNISLNHHFDLHPDLTELEVTLAALHNAVHASMNVYQEPAKWYHSKAFQKELGQWGIQSDDLGHAKALDPDLISETLRKIGQEHLIPEILDFDPVETVKEEKSNGKESKEPEPQLKEVKFKANVSKAKMKKWSCACNPPINVRCAVTLNAHCNECLEDFKLQ